MAMPAYVPAPFACPIDGCNVFPYDTAEDLAAHLAADHFGDSAGTPATVITSRPTTTTVITSRPEVVDQRGRFQTVTNGFGGTTTRTIERPKTADLPTTRQTAYLRTLLAEREGIAEAEAIRDSLNRRREAGQLTKVVVSEAIDRLLKVRRPRKDEGHPQRFDRPARDTTVIPEGRYAFTTDAGHTAFCKVKPGRVPGVHFVDLLLGGPRAWRTQDLAVTAQRTIAAKIIAAGIPESAKRFGDEHGVCGQCCSPLSLKRSIDAGYGQDCAEKYGWPY